MGQNLLQCSAMSLRRFVNVRGSSSLEVAACACFARVVPAIRSTLKPWKYVEVGDLSRAGREILVGLPATSASP